MPSRTRLPPVPDTPHHAKRCRPRLAVLARLILDCAKRSARDPAFIAPAMPRPTRRAVSRFTGTSIFWPWEQTGCYTNRRQLRPVFSPDAVRGGLLSEPSPRLAAANGTNVTHGEKRTPDHAICRHPSISWAKNSRAPGGPVRSSKHWSAGRVHRHLKAKEPAALTLSIDGLCDEQQHVSISSKQHGRPEVRLRTQRPPDGVRAPAQSSLVDTITI